MPSSSFSKRLVRTIRAVARFIVSVNQEKCIRRSPSSYRTREGRHKTREQANQEATHGPHTRKQPPRPFPMVITQKMMETSRLIVLPVVGESIEIHKLTLPHLRRKIVPGDSCIRSSIEMGRTVEEGEGLTGSRKNREHNIKSLR